MKLAYLAVLGLAVGAMAIRPESASVVAAREFLGSLSDAQKQAVLVPFSSEQRFQWAYVPQVRKGISWAEMNPAQSAAGQRLLESVLSKEGRAKVESIRQLELVLREIENDNMSRDPEKYWFAVYGEPSASGKWGFRYEGHHTSLTFAFERGVEISSTPQFLGSNPGEVRSGTKKGTSVLRKEQELAYKLLDSLSDAQKAEAVLSPTAPADITTANSVRASLKDHLGLPTTKLTASQKAMFKSLLQAHSDVQSSPEQARRLKRALSDPEVKFAWLGSIKPGEKHYYRIQGDRFLIEYDNTQNDANHIHTVWRDFEEDFGGDALMEHYAHSHAHPR